MADSEKDATEKKADHPPRLREYGDINSLTEGVGGTGLPDGSQYLGYDVKTSK